MAQGGSTAMATGDVTEGEKAVAAAEAAAGSSVTPPVRSVGNAALAGASWLMIQSAIAQVLAFGSKIAVTRLLVHAKEEIGLATLAMTICSFFSFLQPTTLNDVLIQRQHHFKRWANAAFWMSGALVGVMLICAVIAAPIAGVLRHSAVLPFLIVLAILPSVFTGISVVWTADLSVSFRFRAMAFINTMSAIVLYGLTILMAALHCGAWSIVIPTVVAGILTAVWFAKRSQFRPQRHLHFRRWRFLLGDSIILSTAGFFANLTLQADNFFVGVYQGDTALGVYAIAYSASYQFVQLASRSLRGVMLPAFSNISTDDGRREVAFLRTIQLVSLVTMPACMLVIPATPAAVRLLFSKSWDDAAVLMQIFLVTIGFAVISGLSTSMIQSRQFLKLYFAVNAGVGIVFCAAIWPAAAYGSTKTVAICVSVIYAMSGILTPIIASMPSTGKTKLQLLSATLLPFVAGGISAAGAWLICSWTPLKPTDVLWGVLSGCVGPVLYGILVLLFMRSAMNLTIERARGLLRRKR